MITFCDGRFTVERDRYQWILSEWYEGKTKDGGVKRKSKETYHATIEQVCSAIINRAAGDCKDVEELLALLRVAKKMLTEVTNASLESCA